MGLFDRFKERLSRTRAAISDGLTGLFKGGRKIDQTLLDELEELLYTSDLGPLAGELTEDLARLHRRGELKGEDDVREAMRAKLLTKLEGSGGGDPVMTEKPTVILVVGVNGSGKTTSIAKLAHRFKAQGKNVILGAGDTFRAAAADQLQIWADRNGAEIVRQNKDNADPAAVAFDTCSAAIARGMDVAIIDTAGRLHTQSNLM
ncbi:MAG: fused signal recognition particle receptor, partial [Planctomycetota bacterium]